MYALSVAKGVPQVGRVGGWEGGKKKEYTYLVVDPTIYTLKIKKENTCNGNFLGNP